MRAARRSADGELPLVKQTEDAPDAEGKPCSEVIADVGVSGTGTAVVFFPVDFSVDFDRTLDKSPIVAMWCCQIGSITQCSQTRAGEGMF